MVLASSLPFPDLVVSSTVRVNMGILLHALQIESKVKSSARIGTSGIAWETKTLPDTSQGISVELLPISISRTAKRRSPTLQRLPATEPTVRLVAHLLGEVQT